MKKCLALLLALMMILSLGSSFAEEKKVKVVAATFPIYDWLREVIKGQEDHVELTLLQESGVDLHNFQPSVQDIVKISEADLFAYVGGPSDGWAQDAVKEAKNKELAAVSLLEMLGDAVKQEEQVEGMQEAPHAHDHDHDDHDAKEEAHDHDDHDAKEEAHDHDDHDAKEEAHDHDHDHEHHHHGKEVSTFEDHEVKDRSLADWQGRWQSAYPLVMNGKLDKVFEEKAKSGKMTAAEFKKYYQTGYKTDYATIEINGNTITFTDNRGRTASSEYEYVGHVIQNWSSGTRAALYRFEAKDKKSGVPGYIEFNDHMIEPAESAHFHIRMSKKSFDAIKDLETSWPTFYPGGLTGEQVCEEILAHGKHKEDKHDYDHDHDHDHDHEHAHVHEDEHVWLSLRHAAKLTQALADKLAQVDAAHADAYMTNAKAYVEKLNALDAQYQETVDKAENKTLLFGDRFPFRYLVDDYGIKYFAAFSGCSAETEASFETVAFLAGKMDELKLKNIMVIDGSTRKLAGGILAASEQKDRPVLVLDSMQTVDKTMVEGGATYLGVMEKNLEVLKDALK